MVIAIRISPMASSNPLVICSVVLFNADGLSVVISCPSNVHMMYATSIRPTNAIPIMSTTPRSTMPSAFSFNFLNMSKGLVFDLVFKGYTQIRIVNPLLNFHYNRNIPYFFFRRNLINSESGSGKGTISTPIRGTTMLVLVFRTRPISKKPLSLSKNSGYRRPRFRVSTISSVYARLFLTRLSNNRSASLHHGVIFFKLCSPFSSPLSEIIPVLCISEFSFCLQ